MASRGSVLIVDDDPDIGLALSDYLQREGFSVDMAFTAQQAIQQATRHAYDMVLLDVGLPDRDGIEVLHELSEQWPQLPVILLTAFTSLRKTADPAILNKAFAYLTKPYDRHEVKTTIERALSVRSAAIQSGPPFLPMTEAVSVIPPSTPSAETNEGRGPLPVNLQRYERLSQYIQLMQFACDQVAEAILVAGPDKRFCFANKAACDSLGYTREELLVLRIPDVAPLHDPIQFRQRLDTVKQGHPLSYESVHRTKDGREFPIEVSISLLNIQGQEFTCAVIRTLPDNAQLSDPRDEKPGNNGKGS
ncbi:MAG: response regulator [Nitrospirales bacterium]|nr:response regulator [Nitrospirales bacterium]